MFYFTPLPGYFSPFPHGTRALSVASLYLALRGGPRRFTRAFPDPVLLGNTAGRSLDFVYGAVTLCARLSRTLPLSIDLLTPWSVCRHSWQVPRPRCSIAGRLYH